MKILKMAENKQFMVFGNGINRIPRIHVDDLAMGYLQIVKKLPIGEKFIFADDYPCTTYEFNSCLYELMHGHFKKPVRIPAAIVRLLLGKYVSETLMMDCVVSNAKAKIELGWAPVYPTCQEGLQATVALYRKGYS
jgi:nucleoside-diphosphate-sugar epimerase